VSASPVCLSYGENDKEFIFTRIEDSEIAELAAHKNSQCVKQPDSKDCRDITQKFDELAKMIKTLHIMAKDVKKTETK
jgi:enoyl-[acyl-carrier-protein] reductase (NADH)